LQPRNPYPFFQNFKAIIFIYISNKVMFLLAINQEIICTPITCDTSILFFILVFLFLEILVFMDKFWRLESLIFVDREGASNKKIYHVVLKHNHASWCQESKRFYIKKLIFVQNDVKHCPFQVKYNSEVRKKYNRMCAK
jgi:hypothetical protein